MIRLDRMTIGMLLLMALVGCTPNKELSDAEVQGRWVYGDHCAECHENPHPELRKQPPNLHGLFQGKQFPSGTPATDEQLRKAIIEGRGTMPAFDGRLRDEEVRNLVAYLHKLR
jgi:mono/diheme cytochrome c family protein